MRLAFIKQRYVPFGGGEGYLDLLMRDCLSRGHEVHLLTASWKGGACGDIRIHALRTRGLGRAGRLQSFARQVAAAVRAGAFDVSLSLERTYGQDIWRAGEGVHRVWLDRRRSFEPAWKVRLEAWTPRQRALVALEARAVADARLIIANSEVVRADVESVYGDAARRVVVIRNGVDDRQFTLDGREENRRQVRAELGLSPEVPLLLFVGSGYRRKGLTELLRALPLVPGAVLVVLGRDDPGPWRRRAARLGLERRVRFPAPRAGLAPWYHAADVTVLPTWFDSFASVGLESLRCGTPLVTSRYAGVHELVQPGVNGEVIREPADREALAEAVRRHASRSGGGDAPRTIAATVAGQTMDLNCRMTLEAIESVFDAKAGG